MQTRHPGPESSLVRTALAMAIVALAAPGFTLAGGDGLDEEWIAMDRAMIARLAVALPPGDRPAKEWIAAVEPPAAKPGTDAAGGDANDVEPEDRDVEGGARRVNVRLSGGYFMIDVSALVREDRIVEVRVDCPMTGGSDSRSAAGVLRDAWGKAPVVVTEDAVRYSWSDEARRKAHRAALETQFGPRPGVEVPDSLRTEFELLDGALSNLVYGRMYGEDGGPPPGRAAVEALVKAKAARLLRALLRSANPEGRLYAIEGLERLAKGGEVLTDADRAAIDAVKASPVKIHACYGCIVEEREAAAEVLRRQREDDEAAKEPEQPK